MYREVIHVALQEQGDSDTLREITESPWEGGRICIPLTKEECKYMKIPFKEHPYFLIYTIKQKGRRYNETDNTKL